MKHAQKILTILFLLFANFTFAQLVLKADDGATYTIEGTVYFKIIKKDKAGKVQYKVETKIPDKPKGENFYDVNGTNRADFHLVGDRMLILYDVWKGGTKSKDCQIKVLDTKTGKFSESKQLFSTKINSLFSSGEITYTPFYAPDNKKFMVIRNNISPTYAIDSEIVLVDCEDLGVLSTIKLPKYEGQKRIISVSQTELRDSGEIVGVFQLVNEKTRITTKSYSFNVPFKATELQGVKELGGNISSEHNNDPNSHGRFYETFSDYLKDDPIPGVRIQNGSFTSSFVGTINFVLLDDAGNVKKEKAKDLPAELFTYKRNDFSSPFAIRMMDKEPYIILSAGKYNFYSLYSDQGKLYMAEGWNGKLKKFNRRDLEKALDQYKLLNDFKNDKPRREFKDNVNEYFNKEVEWFVKYFDLLNQKSL